MSSFYDQAVASCGLTIAQQALLVNVGRTAPVSRTALADRLGMDRPTLSRTLQPLEKSRLIVAARSEDRRERPLNLSPLGPRKLLQNHTAWETAQQRLIAELGGDVVDQVQEMLIVAGGAAEKIIAHKQPVMSGI